jgi:hypothetical protein
MLISSEEGSFVAKASQRYAQGFPSFFVSSPLTKEVSKPSKLRTNRKVPDVCDDRAFKSIKDFDSLRSPSLPQNENGHFRSISRSSIVTKQPAEYGGSARRRHCGREDANKKCPREVNLW